MKKILTFAIWVLTAIKRGSSKLLNLLLFWKKECGVKSNIEKDFKAAKDETKEMKK